MGQNNTTLLPQPINVTAVSDRSPLPHTPTFILSGPLRLQHWSHYWIITVSILINPDVDINKMKAGLDWKRGRLNREGPDFRKICHTQVGHLRPSSDRGIESVSILKYPLAFCNWSHLPWCLRANEKLRISTGGEAALHEERRQMSS